MRLPLAFLLPLAGRPATAQVEAQAWTFSATLRESVTDNLFLTPDGPGEAISGASLGLGYSRLSPRSSLAVNGWLNGQLFHRQTAYNGVSYGLGVGGQRRLSHLVRGRLAASYADGVNLEALYSGAVGLPQLDVKAGSASTGLELALTPTTALRAGLDVFTLRYRTDILVRSARLPSDPLTPPEVLAPLRPAPRSDLPQAPDVSQQAIGMLSIENLYTLALDYWSWHADLGLVHGFSPRTQANVDLGYRRTYQDPRTFSEGEQLEARGALRRVLDPTANLTLAYTYQDNRFGPGYETQTFSLGADKQLRQQLRLDVSLGASRGVSPEPGGETWALVGGGGLALRLKRTQLAARYTRSRYQALLLGRNQLSDSLYASLGRLLSRRFSGSAWAYYTRAGDSVEDQFSSDGAAAGLSLAGRFGKRTSCGLSYGYQRFAARDFPAVSRSTASLFCGYTWIGQ